MACQAEIVFVLTGLYVLSYVLVFQKYLFQSFVSLAKAKKKKSPFVDSVVQDQTAQNVQSDLDLHCPMFYFEIQI